MSGKVLRAQMSARCCGTTALARTEGPCWQLFVVITGLMSNWPVFSWPASQGIPTVEERAEVLAELGFALAEGSEWEWTEDSTPEYHPHPLRVQLTAAATQIVRLDGEVR